MAQANNAKTKTEIANEEESLKLAVIYGMTEGEINKTNLDKELNNRPGSGKYTSQEVDEGIAITFKDSKRTYLVDSNGNITEYEIKEPEPTPEESSVESFTMSYGVIEVEFLSGTGYKTTTTPNTPILKDGMKAVYWGDSTGIVDTSNPQSNTVEVRQASSNYSEANWYQYIAQTDANDGKTSRWANATTSDGSYYVWIPRYSYRIVYFDTEEHENAYRAGTLTEENALDNNYILGYSDARRIVDSEGKRPTSVTSTTSISVNDKYFRTHPVFDGNPDEGGWDSKLTGIWVMKYEASKPGATATSVGTGTIPMSVPNVRAWTGIDVSTMFTYARDAYNKNGQLNTTLNSHMMKNSEWGAVAYLTESNYGRNGTEISVNQCSDFITGAGRGLNSTEDTNQTGTSQIYNSTYEYNDITEEQKYTGAVGQLSSTTGNVYGIYDISGGSWEYVMGFYQDESGNIHTGYTTSASSGFNGYLNDGTEKTDGIEFPISDKKYYQLYQKTDSDGEDLGDALYETKSWNSDRDSFVYSNSPVFGRSGAYDNTSAAGTFYSSRDYGYAVNNNGFRVCCAVK